MIKFHGSPLGGPKDVMSRFWENRHAMVSFAYKDGLPIVAESCASFALDNGAFTAWKSDKEFDIDGYAAWVNEWKRHPGFDWHLAPDVIDGTEEENDKLLYSWLTRLESHDAEPVPVWHLHESIGRLRRLCGHSRLVALGSSGVWSTPGTPEWMERMHEAMRAICINGRPVCKLHGLRMLSVDIFTRFPFASADSTNAVRNSMGASKDRFGMYPPIHQWQRANIIAQGVEAHNSAAVWERQDASERLFA